MTTLPAKALAIFVCLFVFFSNSPFFCKIEKDAATTRQAQPHDLNKSQTTLFSENNQNKIIHNFFLGNTRPSQDFSSVHASWTDITIPSNGDSNFFQNYQH